MCQEVVALQVVLTDASDGTSSQRSSCNQKLLCDAVHPGVMQPQLPADGAAFAVADPTNDNSRQSCEQAGPRGRRGLQAALASLLHWVTWRALVGLAAVGGAAAWAGHCWLGAKARGSAAARRRLPASAAAGEPGPSSRYQPQSSDYGTARQVLWPPHYWSSSMLLM